MQAPPADVDESSRRRERRRIFLCAGWFAEHREGKENGAKYLEFHERLAFKSLGGYRNTLRTFGGLEKFNLLPG